jgi:hypothetical protein
MSIGPGGGFYVLDNNNNLVRESNPANLRNQIWQALDRCPNGRMGRLDSQGRKVYGLHSTAKRLMKDYITELFASQARRSDSFSPGMGLHAPEDLTFRFEQVLEEPRPPLNAAGVWPTDTRVPPGALTYRQSRMQGTGEAIVYRGGFGSDIKSVGIGRAFLEAGIVYVVSKATLDMMEQMRSDFTGFDTQDAKMRQARWVIEELENRWTWDGSAENDLWGLLNHPYIDTAYSGVVYKNSTSTDDIIEDLARWANYAELESKSAFRADTCLISVKLHVYLSNRPRATGTDTSVWKWFLEANPHITRVIRVRELDDVKGAGVHGMSFIRGGQGISDASATIVKPMGITLLPPDVRTLGTEMLLLSGYGGLNHREVGDSLNVFVDTN